MNEENDMHATPRGTSAVGPKVDFGRVTAGLGLIAAGVAIWLVREGRVDPVDLATFWPVILILIGLGNLACRRQGPPVLLLLGCFFLLYNLGWVSWPVALIGLGALFLVWGWREGARTDERPAR